MSAWSASTRAAIDFLELVMMTCRYAEAFIDAKGDPADKVTIKAGKYIDDLFSETKRIRSLYYEQGDFFELIRTERKKAKRKPKPKERDERKD